MYPKEIVDELVRLAAELAERVRHLESQQYVGISSVWKGGGMRNADDFDEGSQTAGIQEAVNDLPP